MGHYVVHEFLEISMAHSPVFIGSQVCIALVGPEIHTLSATPSAGLVLVVLSAVTTTTTPASARLLVVIVFVVIVVLPRRSLLCFLLSVLFFLLYRWPQCKSWLISGRCR